MRRQAERIFSGVLATMRTPLTSVLCTIVGETTLSTTRSPGSATSSSSDGREPLASRTVRGGVSAPEFFKST